MTFYIFENLHDFNLISEEIAETPCYVDSGAFDATLNKCESCSNERIWYDAQGQGYCFHCLPLES